MTGPTEEEIANQGLISAGKTTFISHAKPIERKVWDAAEKAVRTESPRKSYPMLEDPEYQHMIESRIITRYLRDAKPDE